MKITPKELYNILCASRSDAFESAGYVEDWDMSGQIVVDTILDLNKFAELINQLGAE